MNALISYTVYGTSVVSQQQTSLSFSIGIQPSLIVPVITMTPTQYQVIDISKSSSVTIDAS